MPILANSALLGIKGKDFIVESEGREEKLPCDTAVVLPAMSENLTLYNEIRSEGIEVHIAGSAKGEGNEMIVDAIRDGREAGLAL